MLITIWVLKDADDGTMVVEHRRTGADGVVQPGAVAVVSSALRRRCRVRMHLPGGGRGAPTNSIQCVSSTPMSERRGGE